MSNLLVTYSKINPILEWSPYPDSILYYVYRGTTKENLAKIKGTPLTQYKDTEIDFTKKFDRVNYWYQISSIKEDGTEIKFSSVETVNQNINYPYRGIYREIVRRNNLMLKRIAGEEVTFYIRKGAGRRCPKCFNQITRDTDLQSSICDVCYGTTFEGGYEVIQGYVRIRRGQEYASQVVFGYKLETGGKTGWVADYPIVNDSDLIKLKNGMIYTISNPTRTRQKDYTTIQTFNLKPLETTHPLYGVLG